MKAIKKMTAGTLTRSNTALAIFAATLLVGGTATEASAKSRHHYRGHHFQHVSYREHHVQHVSHRVSDPSESLHVGSSSGSWRDANASIGGHSFSGVAS